MFAVIPVVSWANSGKMKRGKEEKSDLRYSDGLAWVREHRSGRVFIVLFVSFVLFGLQTEKTPKKFSPFRDLPGKGFLCSFRLLC